jgi:hypothetical protein
LIQSAHLSDNTLSLKEPRPDRPGSASNPLNGAGLRGERVPFFCPVVKDNKNRDILAATHINGSAIVLLELSQFEGCRVTRADIRRSRASEREAAQLYRLSLLVLGGCALWGVILVGWNSWVLVSGL